MHVQMHSTEFYKNLKAFNEGKASQHVEHGVTGQS